MSGGGGSINAAKLMNHFENNDAVTALISESAHLSETLDNKERILCDCIARIKKDNVKDVLGRLQDAIKMAHDSKDDILMTKLVTEYTELLKANKT
jgi:hypothetical protein